MLTGLDVPPPVVGAKFKTCDLFPCQRVWSVLGVKIGVLGPPAVDFRVILIPEFDRLLGVGRFGLLGPGGLLCQLLG